MLSNLFDKIILTIKTIFWIKLISFQQIFVGKNVGCMIVLLVGVWCFCMFADFILSWVDRLMGPKSTYRSKNKNIDETAKVLTILAVRKSVGLFFSLRSWSRCRLGLKPCFSKKNGRKNRRKKSVNFAINLACDDVWIIESRGSSGWHLE